MKVKQNILVACITHGGVTELPGGDSVIREGDTVVVTGGAWKDTVGVIESINEERQTLTIRVELFGRETPVELNFTEIKKMM